jgi:signal transduction histidine kinase
MDKFKKYTTTLTIYSFFWILLSNLLTIGIFLLLRIRIHLSLVLSLTATGAISCIVVLAIAKILIKASSETLYAVWLAVWHISPTGKSVPAPILNQINHGRELAKTLIQEIYANAIGGSAHQVTALPLSDNLLELVPLPVIALNKEQKIILINKQAADYLGMTEPELLGASIYDTMHLSFQTKQTFDNWLADAQTNRITSSGSWDRVRMQLPDEKGLKQFDLIANYSKDEANGHETMLAIFDHTERYNLEDNSTSYVALAVHELRTPLTVLRGYIEVLEEELDGQLTPELKDFMRKMSASAQTLTAFVSNILNVARVDENALTLSLHEGSWNDLLPQICSDLELRARVRGKVIECNITPNLPTVAVDKVSIYEVLSNLIDNAIKYSGDSTKIVVRSELAKDGTVLTTIQDFGVGIPQGALKHLFTKFYRSHRSKGSVSGSGLGLYLVKAIVTAHGGQVWVQSKEGEGSVFGFSLQPYSSLAAQSKDGSNNGIEREAHGWIKNHSMYRH